MKSKILNYVDFEKANILLEGFNKATGFVTAILDLDGNILSKSGWRQICTDFHRINPGMAVNCTISDTELAKASDGSKYHYYKCLNGMVDVSVPITIRGEHIANLFSGQLFFEDPDISFFKSQAKIFELDGPTYLAALGKVPVVSKEKVEATMNFLVDIAEMIIEMTAEKLDQIELYDALKKSEKALLESQFQLKKNMKNLISSENKYRELYYENQNKQTLLKTLIDSVPDLIFYKDRNGVYLGCNTAFGMFLGRAEDKIVGRSDEDLFSKEQAQSFIAVDNEIIKKGKPYKDDFMSLYPDGTEVRFETLKTSYCDKNGTVLGVIGVSRDITERKRKEDEIIYLTHHDGLTGLYNRTYFDELKDELSKRENLPVSVIIGDINGLKLFNDAFGHREGDKLLVEVAKILMSCVRPEDVIARTGGDEFGILLPRSDSKTAQSVVEKIKSACECYSTSSNKETYCASIALGYATKSICEEPIDKVIKSAEESMYRKKLLEHKSQHSSIISSIKTTLYEKSHETEEHAERLADLSKKLGAVIGLSDKEMDELELLSMLHDIGKIGIEDNILTKAGRLTDDERIEMEKHSEIGYRIAMASPELRHIAEYILCHHECWDGEGYPQGLSGREIPLLSRILSIVDSYDAMTNDRVYRKAITKENAIAEIVDNAGTQFDPEIAKLFVNEVL